MTDDRREPEDAGARLPRTRAALRRAGAALRELDSREAMVALARAGRRRLPGRGAGLQLGARAPGPRADLHPPTLARQPALGVGGGCRFDFENPEHR